MRILKHFLRPKTIFAIVWIVSLNLSCFGFMPDQWDNGPFLPTSDPNNNLGALIFLQLLLMGLFFGGLVIFAVIIALIIAYTVANMVEFLVEFSRRPRTRTTHKIIYPETFLLTIADFLPHKQRKILRQEAADLKDEYEEAVLFGKITRARIIVISYYLGVGWSAFIWMADQVKRVIKISKK